MDTVTLHKQIVRDVIEYVFALCPPSNEVEIQKIIDDENGHYLLHSVGWENDGRAYVYASFVHIDVRETGRVWLQHDGTDLRIAKELIERGIPKSEIVVGFQSPSMRAHMDGYAIA
jgi:XisI protein